MDSSVNNLLCSEHVTYNKTQKKEKTSCKASNKKKSKKRKGNTKKKKANAEIYLPHSLTLTVVQG
jgi:hypothetical protein